MAEAYDDRPDALVPADGPLTADDLRRVRFSLAFRGYRMSEVDALLDRLAGSWSGRRTPTEAAADPDAQVKATLPSARGPGGSWRRPVDVRHTPPVSQPGHRLRAHRPVGGGRGADPGAAAPRAGRRPAPGRATGCSTRTRSAACSRWCSGWSSWSPPGPPAALAVGIVALVCYWIVARRRAADPGPLAAEPRQARLRGHRRTAGRRGPGLSVLAHVGMLVGVIVFTWAYLTHR